MFQLTRITAAICLAMLLQFSIPSPAQAQAFYPRETESYVLNYAVRSKQTMTAVTLSTVLGFGAGHFYAEESGSGIIFAAGQFVGAALLLGSRFTDDADIQGILGATGGLIFAGFRIADIYLAPASAAKYNIGLVKRLRIKSLVLSPHQKISPDQKNAEAVAATPTSAGSRGYGLALALDW